MQGEMFIITPDSTEATIERRALDGPPSLADLQTLVGGYIEPVPLLHHYVTRAGLRPCIAYCNEDGRLVGLPVNATATGMWSESVPQLRHQPLLGTIVVLTGDAEFMESL
jgi:hypothetical protein